MSKVRHLFHVASDKKWLTYIGIALVALGIACSQIDRSADPLLDRICGIVAFLGTFVTALGKGIGDRREVRTESESLEELRKLEG